jgi:hypothetical protein
MGDQLARPGVGLDVHVDDVVNVPECDVLNNALTAAARRRRACRDGRTAAASAPYSPGEPGVEET